MELTPEQTRVLGCLIEKSTTTPDNYPLTSNSLVSACNQKSSRDPQMDLRERDIDAAMLELRQLGLARTLTGGGRTVKHRHVADEALGLTPAALAVLSVLMLRGPQTTGELRTRCERQHGFDDLAQVEQVLDRLVARPEPLVRRLEREAGRKEPRWMHLLDGTDLDQVVAVAEDPVADDLTGHAVSQRSDRADTRPADLEAVHAELGFLRRRVDHLYQLLGEDEPESEP